MYNNFCNYLLEFQMAILILYKAQLINEHKNVHMFSIVLTVFIMYW